MKEQFLRLNLRIQLQTVDEEGRYFGSPLEMVQNIDLQMTDFLDMAQILHQFYDLANQIKYARGR